MDLLESIMLLVFALMIVGGSIFIISYISPDNDNKPKSNVIINEQTCNSNGGNWNDCGNKCSILNIGNPNVYCPQVCEEVCECGTITGLSCPNGYRCILPEGIADAQGFCDDN